VERNPWSVRAALRTALIGAIAVSVSAIAPAAAQADVTPLWSNETAMVNDAVAANRATMILDPGRGSRLTRAHVLARSFRYEGVGFDKNFLWYAPQRVMTVSAGTSWSTCLGGRASDGWCSTVDTGQPIGRSFTGDTALTVLEHGGAFIGLAGGNWSTGVPLTGPVPVITGAKFHDRDSDGQRDADEPGLAGWTLQLVRQSSTVGQPAGSVRTTLTDDAGSYRFDLSGLGPGTYYVQDVDRPGWDRTTLARQNVTVGQGIGAAVLTTPGFGAVESSADVVAADVTLVDPPTRLESNEAAKFTVRSVLENHGPATAVDVVNAVDVTVPDDCVASPVEASRVTLSQLFPVTVSVDVEVTCTEPGRHPMTFTDRLSLATPTLADPDQTNNTAAVDYVGEVNARTDVSVTAASVDCTARQDVGSPFACVVTGDVSSAGPRAPTTATTTTALAVPADCVAVPAGPEVRAQVALPSSGAAPVATTYSVTCSERGSHDVSASVTAAVDEEYVEEVAPGDEQRSAADAVGVFQAADLAAGDLSLVCSQREGSRADFRCIAQMTVTNLGPAGNVQAAVRLAAATPSGCTLEPSADAPALVTLGTGQSTAVNRTWRFVCAAGKVGHSVLVTGDAGVAPAEGYAEDRAAGNNATRLLWQPSDAKPHPGAGPVKVTKVSELPFAVLSTDTVSAVTDVDPATLRFGVTGAESSVLSCTGRTKDVDGDGRADLTCAADAGLTGITCATTTATVSGYLRDGTPFVSQDDITVAGCKSGPTKGTAATITVAASTTTLVSTAKGTSTTVSTAKGGTKSKTKKTRVKAKATGKR
jgi:hypothetical protein